MLTFPGFLGGGQHEAAVPAVQPAGREPGDDEEAELDGDHRRARGRTRQQEGSHRRRVAWQRGDPRHHLRPAAEKKYT